MTVPTVAVEPLLDFVDPDHEESTRDLAELIGASRSSIQRWKRSGIPVWTADRIAVDLGFMPWEIFPDFDEATLGLAYRADELKNLAHEDFMRIVPHEEDR